VRGQPPPIVIRQAQASFARLPPEEPVLFDEIRERLPLPAIQPPGQDEQQQPESRGVVHEREVISRTAISRPAARRSSRGTEWDDDD
jgi:hypothetical protein